MKQMDSLTKEEALRIFKSLKKDKEAQEIQLEDIKLDIQYPYKASVRIKSKKFKDEPIDESDE
jgi:hypothetical protein